MQSTSNVPAIAAATIAAASAPTAPEATTVAPTATPAKPRKPKAAKPIVVPPLATASDSSDRDAERKQARDVVIAYYSGRSLPFKAASDTFAPFRTDKAPKAPSTRQAALLASMLISGDNIDKRGNFTRGGFVSDGKRVQPETGCLSDMHGRVIKHVSGPLAGKQARDAVFNLDLKRARAEISAQLGDKLGKLAVARIDKLLAA